MNKGKMIGKIVTVLTVIIVVICLGGAWYLGGQKRTLDKYCSSIARGNGTDYNELTGKNEDISSFKAAWRDKFKASGYFDSLSDTDVIGYDVRISQRKILSPEKWECTADVDLFCHDMYKRCNDVVFTLEFSGGSWHIPTVSQELV